MTFSAIPKWTMLDSSGDPVVGGTYYFYEAGTSTPKNVYSDAARSISIGASATTDSRGEVGPIYLDTTAATKVVAKDADANTLWTIDNLTAPSGSVNITGVSHTVSPLDYGAVGDGVADESSEVQSAIDAATGTVDLAGKTYRCDSTLTLPSAGNISLRDGVIDATQNTSSNVLEILGSVATADALTASADPGDTTVSIADTSAYSVGDWVRISSTDAWGNSTTRGELARIKSLTSTVITLDGGLRLNHATGNAAQVARYTLCDNVTLINVRILCSYASTQDAIAIRYAKDVTIDSCVFDNVNNYAVRIRDSIRCIVRDCSVSTCGTAVGVGPSVLACHVYRTLATNCTTGIDIGTVGDGAALAAGVVVDSCTFSGCTTGIHADDLADSAVIRDSSIDGGTTGILCDGAGTSIRNIRCSNQSSYGISVVPQVSDEIVLSSDTHMPYTSICGCSIEYAGTYGVHMDVNVASINVQGLSVADTKIAGSGTSGIYLRSNQGDLEDVNISRCVIDGTNATSAILVTSSSGSTITGINIRDVSSDSVLDIDSAVSGEASNISIVDCSFDGGITVDLCDHVSVRGTSVTDTGSAITYAMNFGDCNDVRVAECSFVGSLYAVRNRTTGATDVKGCVITGCYADTNTGGFVVDQVSTGNVKGVAISNNVRVPFDANDTVGIHLIGVEDATVFGNTIRMISTSADAIIVNDGTRVAIVGNMLTGGGSAIQFSTAASSFCTINSNVLNGNNGNVGNAVEILTTLNNSSIVGNYVNDFAYAVDSSGGTATEVMVASNAHSYASGGINGSVTYGAFTSTAADLKNAKPT